MRVKLVDVSADEPVRILKGLAGPPPRKQALNDKVCGAGRSFFDPRKEIKVRANEVTAFEAEAQHGQPQSCCAIIAVIR
jgi:hypothetical protein